MHTTFFFVLLVYYVYNYMFLHFFKTYKMYKVHKIHKPLPVSGFHRPIIRSYQNMWSCELYINPSNAALNQFKFFRVSYLKCSLSLHLRLGLPISRHPRGWYWKTSFGRQLLSILFRWYNHFFWYRFDNLMGIVEQPFQHHWHVNNEHKHQ
jgi:hypothetical protein